jgi:anti-sigma regulatory factor (Ser/Thr protein kinase)
MGGERLGSWGVLAVPRSVPELRRLLRDAIAGRGFDEDVVGLAVTEAVTNVVRHAYPGSIGPIKLSVEALPGELEVIVADEGIGRGSKLRGDPTGLRVGLALIAELCASVRIEPTDTGTMVTMRFARTKIDPPVPPT